MNIKGFKIIIAVLAVVILALGGLLIAQRTLGTEKSVPLPETDTSISTQQREATVTDDTLIK